MASATLAFHDSRLPWSAILCFVVLCALKAGQSRFGKLVVAEVIVWVKSVYLQVLFIAVKCCESKVGEPHLTLGMEEQN